jgi:putative aldouronate transport system permease protein
MKKSKGRLIFQIFNVLLVSVITISCLIPIINLFAYSLSSSSAIIANKVFLWPVDFNFKAYEYVMDNMDFWKSVLVSSRRVLLGVPINVILAILAAYPLSKPDDTFPARKYYVAFILIAMLFSGGLMPTYFIVAKTGLIDTIWSLILPGAVPIFSIIVLMNFFRGIPSELEESVRLDGANQLQILTKIFIPLSKPSIATITLFSLIGHWNSWFDGLIYSNYTANYPLQSYLQTLVVATTDFDFSDLDSIAAMMVNDTNMKAAQIFISIIPLMLVYPFLQRYFTTGLILGSVKG